MSGSNFSAPDSNAESPLTLTVHAPPQPDVQARTTRGRLKMLLVLAVCAAPVVASYLTYFVIRPQGRTNYSELQAPARPIPADLPLTDLQGAAVKPDTLKGQWLLVVVGGGQCDATCEKQLWLQRQLRETLGRDKDRLDKVWLVTDNATVRPETLNGIRTNTEMTVLRVPKAALAAWLAPAKGELLENHLYIVDPLGHWMMRAPPQPEPAKVKSDVVKLLRASAGWDKAGR
jgi:hypothetical protein